MSREPFMLPEALAHDRVEDAIVDKVQKRVLSGMGLVVLHSAHMLSLIHI